MARGICVGVSQMHMQSSRRVPPPREYLVRIHLVYPATVAVVRGARPPELVVPVVLSRMESARLVFTVPPGENWVRCRYGLQYR